MSTLLEEPTAEVQPHTTPSQRLRTTTAAARVSLSWLGTRKTLTADQKALAADVFQAEGEFLSAGKKLLDTKHSAFKAVTAIRGRIVAYWKSVTLPYPEPGIRLIRQDKIEAFNAQLNEFKQDLDEAVWRLDEHYAELRSAARDRLGSLYKPGGDVRCVYNEAIDLTALGSLKISRGSHVEPDDQGRWLADLAPVSGPTLGPFPSRSEALAAEHQWLEGHWLTRCRW